MCLGDRMLNCILIEEKVGNHFVGILALESICGHTSFKECIKQTFVSALP